LKTALESARRRDEAQLRREALTYLSDEDLDALEVVIEARDHGASGEDLYRVAGERGRREICSEVVDRRILERRGVPSQ
jgi:hypothetical protein